MPSNGEKNDWIGYCEKRADPSFEALSTGGAVAGVATGATLAALLSYLRYRKDKKQSGWKKFMKGLGWSALGGLAGGLGGAYIGRMYGRHSAYRNLRNDIAKQLANENGPAKKGRVIYIDCNKNRYEPGEQSGLAGRVIKKIVPSGLPVGHSMLATIDDETGDMNVYSVSSADKGTAGRIAMDYFNKGLSEGNQALVETGAKVLQDAEYGGVSRLDVIPVKGIGKMNLDDKGLALFLGGISERMGYGRSVVLHEGEKGVDLRVPEKFFLDSYKKTFGDGGGGYSACPGGYNCATSAREAFDAAQTSQSSHWRDMLWGGGSTANAPSMGTSWSNAQE